MDCMPVWQRDEFRQVGTDYSDPAAVAAWHATLESKRSVIEAENDAWLDLLCIGPANTLLELGCGSGLFGVQAAKRCARVHAADVSSAMLDLARRNARRAGLSNIEFHHAGFLTYRHEGPPVTAIASQTALHHLPDAWKMIALRRLADMIRPGGRLYLQDVVFHFDPRDHAEAFARMRRELVEHFGGEEWGRQLDQHLREEFSTFDWIMEGILTRSGFRIDRADYRGLGRYLCTRV